MQTRWARTFLSAAVFTFSLTIVGRADNGPGGVKPEALRKKDYENPTDALSALQAAHAKDGTTFILQGELDPFIAADGGGACPSAAAIDLLQAMRLMAGLDKLPNPHQAALCAFAKHPALLKGRLSNDQFAELVGFHQGYMEGIGLAVEVESAPNSGHRGRTKTWPEQNGPDLRLVPRRAKVVSYTVTDAKGEVGRHFVLLKANDGLRIDVVDPFRPVKDHQYVLEYKKGEKGEKSRLFLNNPPEHPRRENLTFEVNTVFTVSLAGAADMVPAKVVSVDAINAKIDHVAKELRPTKEWLDPRAWRKKTAAFGLPALDLPEEHGGSNWPASKIIEVFRHAGTYNLNFRDIVGGARETWPGTLPTSASTIA